MSDVIVTIYPRLYTSMLPGPSALVRSRGDLAVGLLEDWLVDRRFIHNRWEFESFVLDTALRLFGDFQTWVQAQRNNPQITGYNKAFIEDTLKFINGEDRELQLVNWIELVSQGHADIHLADLRVPRVTPRLQQSPSTVKALVNWCSRPNGLEDLLQTLNLLFGRARP